MDTCFLYLTPEKNMKLRFQLVHTIRVDPGMGNKPNQHRTHLALIWSDLFLSLKGK